MTLYDLAKRIADFIWKWGLDSRFSSHGELVTEIYLGLCGDRQMIAEYVEDKYYDFAKANNAEGCEIAQRLYWELTNGGRRYA